MLSLHSMLRVALLAPESRVLAVLSPSIVEGFSLLVNAEECTVFRKEESGRC
jgi:hypothetical protein